MLEQVDVLQWCKEVKFIKGLTTIGRSINCKKRIRIVSYRNDIASYDV